MYVAQINAWGELGIGLTVALFSATLAGLVGNRVAHRWQLELKRREQDLQASREFTVVYGEFHAVWKLWHAHLKADSALVSGVDEALRRSLLERASTEEGRYNSLVLKLVAERKLGEPDTTVLAMFREAQQCLRESLEQRSLLATRKPRDGEPAGGRPVQRRTTASRSSPPGSPTSSPTRPGCMGDRATLPALPSRPAVTSAGAGGRSLCHRPLGGADVYVPLG